MRRAAALAGALATLLLASPADAAQRYASPVGSNVSGECPQANPCSLKEALGKAKPKDEVIIAPGAYSGEGLPFPETPPELFIHGEAGAPAPRISASHMGAVLYLGGKSTLTHIELSNTYADAPVALYCYPGSLVERVVASASGKGSTGATMHSECVIRDSLLTSSGENSVALNGVGFFMGNQHGSAVNDTIIASGPGSVGARSYWLPGGPGEVGTFELIVQNAIAQGNAADLEATTTATSLGLITVSNSNFDSKKESPGATVTNAGGNQSAAPLFVNAEGGNYREAAGSPTIDAGSANPLAGTLDLADNARTQGAAIDIGAYELVPPPIPPVTPVLTGQLQSLSLAPSAFVPANVGGAVLSGARKKPPVTTRVTYSLSASAAVAFSVERRTTGRRVGRKCVKRTKANASKKRCPLYRKVRGGFSVNSATGSNHFVFTGRIGNKALSPGRYRLAGSAGGVTKTAKFRILK